MHGLGSLRGLAIRCSADELFRVWIGPWAICQRRDVLPEKCARSSGERRRRWRLQLLFYRWCFHYPYNVASQTWQLLTPNLTLPIVLLAITLIHARGSSARMCDAVVIGKRHRHRLLPPIRCRQYCSSRRITTTAFSQRYCSETLLRLAVVALVELAGDCCSSALLRRLPAHIVTRTRRVDGSLGMDPASPRLRLGAQPARGAGAAGARFLRRWADR